MVVRRINPLGTRLALLALAMGLVYPSAGAESPGSTPASEVRESLSQSIQRRRELSLIHI